MPGKTATRVCPRQPFREVVMQRARWAITLSLLVATPALAGSVGTTNTNNITASVAPKCTKGTSGVLSLNIGVNASGAIRRMQDSGGGGNYLTYEIYNDAARTIVWNAVN